MGNKAKISLHVSIREFYYFPYHLPIKKDRIPPKGKPIRQTFENV